MVSLIDILGMLGCIARFSQTQSTAYCFRIASPKCSSATGGRFASIRIGYSAQCVFELILSTSPPFSTQAPCRAQESFERHLRLALKASKRKVFLMFGSRSEL